MKDLISVIVPVYNVENYLRECVDSVLAQTYSNLEILLIDDGSTDSSGAICDEYAARDSRIRVIHQKNGGLSAARNTGLDAAKGKYIEFLDSDDWVDTELLENQIQAIAHYDAEIAAVTMMTNDAAPSMKTIKDTGINVCLLYFQDSMMGMTGWCGLSACGKLFDAQLIRDLRFPVGLVNEDVAFTPITFLLAKTVYVVDNGMYHYRRREGSITGANHSNVSSDLIVVLSKLLQYSEEHRIAPEDVFAFTVNHLYENFCNVLQKKAPASDDFLKNLRVYLKKQYIRMLTSDKIVLMAKVRLSELVLFNSTRIPFRNAEK